jgi:hypothetical protein
MILPESPMVTISCGEADHGSMRYVRSRFRAMTRLTPYRLAAKV